MRNNRNNAAFILIVSLLIIVFIIVSYFMLSKEFQQQIPETMFVYPVIQSLDLPDWWDLNPEITPVNAISFSSDELQNWIAEWSTIMR